MPLLRNPPDGVSYVMPALYIAAGAAVIVFQPSVLGIGSGALLILAAVTMLVLNRRNDRGNDRREEDAQTGRTTSIFAPPSRLAVTTEFVRAIAPAKLGHADIDRQHRGLASRSATLRVAFLHADAPADLELMVYELIDSLAQHLQTEAEAMQRLGVMRSPELAAQDLDRLAEAQCEVDAYRMGRLNLEELIRRVAGDLVAGHLKSAHPALPSIQDALRQLRGNAP